MRAGKETAWWAGLVAGGVLVVGLLTLTFFATHWFTHDPATLAGYRAYWPPRAGLHETHFRNITAFAFSANASTAALIGVLLLPALSYVGGTVGAVVGCRRRRG